MNMARIGISGAAAARSTRFRVAATIAFLAVIASPARADEVWRWRPFVVEASGRFGMPTRWIERVMQAESGGRTALAGKPIRSRAGAIGLMQLMPATWDAMRIAHGLGGDPDDPRDNILAGTAYLRAMYDRFGYPGLFGAYNAGPGRYAAHLSGRARLPDETVAYLAAVAGPGGQTTHAATVAGGASAVPAPVDRLFAVAAQPFEAHGAVAASTLPRRQSTLFAIENEAGR